MPGTALKSVDSWDAAIGGDAICLTNCVPNCSNWNRGKGCSSSTSIKPTVASKGEGGGEVWGSKLTVNRSSAAKSPAPKKNKKKQKKYAQPSSHCFVMGVLITPRVGQRNSSTVFRELLHRGVLQGEEDHVRKQTELAAQLIRQFPLPPEGRVVVLGNTAFDAKAICTACEERKFSWIVPINP